MKGNSILSHSPLTFARVFGSSATSPFPSILIKPGHNHPPLPPGSSSSSSSPQLCLSSFITRSHQQRQLLPLSLCLALNYALTSHPPSLLPEPESKVKRNTSEKRKNGRRTTWMNDRMNEWMDGSRRCLWPFIKPHTVLIHPIHVNLCDGK